MIQTEIKYKAMIHYEHFPRSVRDICKIYSVSKSTLSRWVRAAPRCLPVCKRTRTTKYTELVSWVSGLVSKNPYMTCTDIRKECIKTRGVCPSPTTVYRLLCRANITHKRAQLTRDAKGIKDHPLYHHHDPYNNAIAIDECHFDASDHVRYGWSHKSSRLPKRKKDRPQRLSLLFAVSRHGVVLTRLVKGRVNSSVFVDFIKDLPKRANLLLDNASIHRAKLFREFCVQHEMTLNYLPPYCPWYNPAEYAFSNIKRVFRTRRLTSDDFDGDVKYAVTQLPCMEQSFVHAKCLWVKDKETVEHLNTP